VKIYHIKTDGKASSTGAVMRAMVKKYYLDMVEYASLSAIQMFTLIKNLPYRPDPPNVETLMRPKYTMTMRGYGGDCLSGNTRVLSDTGFKKISDVKVGDTITGKKGWTKVKGFFDKGRKRVRKYILSNGGKFIATNEHRCILSDENEKLAGDLIVGDRLFHCSWIPRIPGDKISGESKVMVKEIEDAGIKRVFDLTTEDHGIYLPDADIVVHNCDCKALALAAWAYLQKIPYRFIAIRRPGRTVLHHVAIELYMEKQWIFFDPTYRFNSFGEKREEAERVII
jgi:hypothetical protein